MTTSNAPTAGRTGTAAIAAARAGPRYGSVWWLVAVAAAFSGAQLIFVAPKLGLSWDEIVYLSQVSVHAPAAVFGAPRARGITLLVAPVALLTSSVLALRVYLSVLSGVGLLLAMLVWRRLRPAWAVALAGLFFASLWVTQYYGPQAMPDLWVALSALAAVGFFLQAADGYVLPLRTRAARLAGLAGSLALAALVRPGDAVFLGAGLVAAVVAVRAWRRWQLLVATAAGVLAGAAEWIVEAYIRFDGPLARLRHAGGEQGGFGSHAGILAELRALNGPTLCRPCMQPIRSPGLTLWWLALPVLVLLGLAAAQHAGRLRSSLLAAVCAVCVGFQYLFLISYAAPRFLLPVYALVAIPVADGVGWLLCEVRSRRKPVTWSLVAVVLLAQLVSQHVVLSRQVATKVSFFADYARIAADLHRLGIRPPCLVNGVQQIPIAFYTGCGSATSLAVALRTGHPPLDRLALLMSPRARPPGYAMAWHRAVLPGLRNPALVVAYLPRS